MNKENDMRPSLSFLAQAALIFGLSSTASSTLPLTDFHGHGFGFEP